MASRNLITLPPLKRLRLQLRKNLSGRRAGAVTAIEVDNQTLRVVQTTPQGGGMAVTGIMVERLDLAADADRSAPAVMGEAIAKTLASLRIKPGSVVMGVPRALVVLRTLVLPGTEDTRELASMVHFQVGKDLPFRLDEAVIDFKVRRQILAPAKADPPDKANGSADGSPSEPAPKLEVMVAAVKRDVVQFYQQMAAAAGLNLIALGWISSANARCVEACRVADGHEGVALISLRPDEVGIDVMAHQSLLFSRGVAIKPANENAHQTAALPASPMLEKPEAASPAKSGTPGGPQNFVEAAIIEVVRSLHSYGGMEHRIPVAKLVVVGATGSELAVVEALKGRINIPCQLLDLTRALSLPASAQEHAAGAISALGLALGATDSQGLPFDFLNPKRPAVQRNFRRLKILAAAAAGIALLLLFLGVRTRLVNQRLKIQRQVQAELAEAEKKRPIYRQMRQQATTVQGWVQEGRDWLEHYAYLSAILPGSDEIYIASLSVGGRGSIRLAVQARSGEILAKLDKQLRAAGYDLKPLAITPGADKFGYRFRSTVELSAPEKMKIDLARVQPPPRPDDDGSLDTLGKASRKGGGK
jgi:Tfp pilus assembly PilM family ATPase